MLRKKVINFEIGVINLTCCYYKLIMFFFFSFFQLLCTKNQCGLDSFCSPQYSFRNSFDKILFRSTFPYMIRFFSQPETFMKGKKTQKQVICKSKLAMYYPTADNNCPEFYLDNSQQSL